jgi:hypothetical protein
MKVLRRTSDELLLEDRAIGLRLFGGIFVAAGLAAAYAGGVGGLLIGVVAIGGGGAIAVLVPATLIHFDRRSGTVTLSRRGAFSSGTLRTVPLASVREVEVESVPDSDGGHTFRVRLLIEGLDPLPFTPWSSSGKEPKRMTMEVVRDWLGA